ncbi:MAG: DUF262 domain-containing protein [Myxococcota bacterium]
MRADIQGKHLALQDVFGKGFVFHVPGYQRPYRWEVEHCEALVGDLLDAMPRAGEIRDARPYFLGSIVLVKTELSADAEVIDGQQRLTTLTILLAALQATTDAETQANLKEYLRQDRNVVTGAPAQFRLHLRDRDGTFFRDYVQEQGGLERLERLTAQAVEVHERIRKNALALRAKLLELPLADRQRLAQFMMQRCYLVVVSTEEAESAFRIFSVLNSRGLELSSADIIKSHVLGRVEAERRDRCTERWEEAEARLGNERFDALLMHLCVMALRRRPTSSLQSEFMSAVVGTRSAEKIVDFIALNASFYEQLLRAEWAASEGDEALDARLRKALRWLNEVDHSDWAPAALSMCRRLEKLPDLVTGLEALERLTAFLFLTRANVNVRVARYGRVLEWLTKRGADSPLSLTAEERQRARETLDGEIYAVVKTRQYVLRRLDESLGDGAASYDAAKITVEHVLPQNPRPTSQWGRLFSPLEAAHWTHRLANLVLLARAKNAEASNFDFEEKKSKYFTSPRGVSTFALTTQVLREREWTPAILARRQKDLVARLSQEWKLDAES